MRQLKQRESQLAKTSRLTLEHLHEQMKAGAIKELPLILKADVQGSVEVLSETLNKLGKDKVKVKTIHKGTGAITETDVLLASASNAIIIGFNVRPERKAADLAVHEGVDIRLHTIIYNITNEIKSAMVGMLDQQFKEAYQGALRSRYLQGSQSRNGGWLFGDGWQGAGMPRFASSAITSWCTKVRSYR